MRTSTWAHGARELASVVVPLSCVGCGRRDVVVCWSCAHEFAGPARQVDHLTLREDSEPIPVWSAAPYQGRCRAVVLAWKSGRRPDLRPVMARIGRQLGTELGAQVCRDLPAGRLAIVPAPSGLTRRLRGRLVVADLALAVGAGVAACAPPGTRVEVVDLLVRGSGSQAGRGVRERSRGRRIRALSAVPAGTRVLLVDDVLTTGATLAACARAVTLSGGVVVAGLTLADAGRRESRAALPPAADSELSRTESPRYERAPRSGERDAQNHVG